MSTASAQRWERRLSAAFLAATAALTTLAGPATDASAAVATPTVTGPITGGLHGRPYTSATFDLGAFGYVEEEYFLEGTATTYGPAPSTVLGSDGMWSVVATGTL